MKMPPPRPWLAALGLTIALACGQAPVWAQTVITTGSVATLGSSTIAVTPGNQGSPWSFPIGDVLAVGYGGVGTLTIANGGSVFSGGVIGYANGVGTVTVDGAGSSWTVNEGVLLVGYSNVGTLTIQNGGRVSSGWGMIAGGSNSSGIVTVDGAGSSWTTNGYPLAVGSGSGSVDTLTIQNGGSVQAGSVIMGLSGTGATGTVNLNTGGVLQTDIVASRNGNTDTIHFNGGILQAIGTQSDFLHGFSAGNIVVNSGGAFIDTQAYNVGIATASLFTGPGGLTKLGSGTLTIAGGNTWGGNTIVSAGTLALGSYSQASGQTLGISETSTSSYGKLNVTGTATFNAGANLTVNVAGANSLAKGQTLADVISAGTLNASTFNVTDNSALFGFTPVISGDTVSLNTVNAASVSGIVQTYGLAPARGAAQALDTQLQGTPNGDMATVVTALGLLPDQGSVARAAAQTLPINSGSQAITDNLASINHIVSDRLAPGGTGLSTGDSVANKHVWVKPFGSHASQDDENGASGFWANTWGLAVGAEGDWDTTRLGLAYAYANTHVNGNTALSGTGANAQVSSNVLAFYGSRPVHGLMLDFQADTGWNDNSSQRGLSFGNLNRTASGNYGTWSAHVGTGLSKTLPLSSDMAFIPEFRVDYTRLQSQAYSESGAGALNLNVNGSTVQSLVLGADARLVAKLGERGKLSAHVGAGYDTINDPGNIVAAYAGVPGQSFTTPGLQHSPWLMTAGLGYDYRTERGTNIALRYDVQGRTGFLNQSASLNVSWVF